jgi:HSP20 family molecular chaperone IbpA
MDSNRRIPINVSVNPSEYSGRSIRLGNPDTSLRDKMNQRMQEFEEESRKWREQFLSSSSMNTTTNTPQPPQSSHLSDHHSRPRMFVNFPDFPEFSSFNAPSSLTSRSTANPSSSSFFPSPLMSSQASHKSFIEEDDHGHKKYKMTFEIGDFKPQEIQVKTEGRQLVVKGDREYKAGSAVESKQFNREITLPDFIEPTSVISFLSDGVLTVEAPVLSDRLEYPQSSFSSSNTTSNVATSGLRNSPFRDNSSPSRSIFASSNNNINNSNTINSRSTNNMSSTNTNTTTNNNNLLNNSATSLASHSTFNTPLYNDLPTNPIVQLNNNNSSSSLNSQPAIYKFNMSEFRPEDISITVTDTSLKIHAVREENDAQGGGKSYREFKREIGLPQGADVKRLKNSLQSDGTLYIEIPVQDNSNFRPPLSPTGLNKSFNNFSLNETSTNNTNSNLNAAKNIVSSNSSSSSSNINNNSNNNNNLVSSAPSHNGNSTKDALIDQTNTGKELRLTFDLTGYKPEDLSVKVIDNNTLKVHAVHIDNSRGNQIHREYTR